MPISGTWGSYNVESSSYFDVSKAVYLQAWVKGKRGGEKFEFVLWNRHHEQFPGRPPSAEITASKKWELIRIPLQDYISFVKDLDLSALFRLSIGFNDSMDSEGTVYLDEIAFVDQEENCIQVPIDEETSITNVGLYIASLLAAWDLDLENYNDVIEKLNKTLTSVETLQKWHGFPQTHNHVVSLNPSRGDTCISSVDLGIFAASLVFLRQRLPEYSARASALFETMEWDWLYDKKKGLLYGCRYPEKNEPSNWHYDWLCADSRLAYFIAIGTQKIPAKSWNNLNRQHGTPKCINRWHFGPGWDGGGLFMAMLPAIFIDETKSILNISTKNFVKDQICYYKKIKAPAWGFSATALPPYGGEYCGYGCFRDEILVPHASILAMDFVKPNNYKKNLKAFEKMGARQVVTDGKEKYDFGFRASVDWKSKKNASCYLILDQAMAFLSLCNNQTSSLIRKLFSQDKIAIKAVKRISDY
jgi:hypothetical protein